MSISTSFRLGKRELICLLLFTCNYVVSVWRGFLFLWVRYFIVALPEPSYNYLTIGTEMFKPHGLLNCCLRGLCTQALQTYINYDPEIDLDLLYDDVEFGKMCFCSFKAQTSGERLQDNWSSGSLRYGY